MAVLQAHSLRAGSIAVCQLTNGRSVGQVRTRRPRRLSDAEPVRSQFPEIHHYLVVVDRVAISAEAVDYGAISSTGQHSLVAMVKVTVPQADRADRINDRA